MSHRWSGWPGAWCLDCGCECPVETALATDWDGESNPMPLYEGYQAACPEPGSRRHDPYGKGPSQ